MRRLIVFLALLVPWSAVGSIVCSFVAVTGDNQVHAERPEFAPDGRPAALGTAGILELDKPIVISRQRTDIRVPAPFMAASAIAPAGELKGDSAQTTIYRFAPTVKGPLVTSEGCGDPKFSFWWNDGAAFSCFCPRVHDLAVDGQGQLHPHPYNNAMGGANDPTGPDAKPRGDGVCLQGTGVRAERLRLFQIQGTALVVRGAPVDGQSGQFGLYDESVSRIDDVAVLQCINGIDSNSGDSRISRCSVSQVAKDGLTVAGPGTYIDDYHGWGCDRSAVFDAEVHAHHLYDEAARIGTHITSKATGSTIDELNIGPATCWSRGVLCEAHNVQVSRLFGAVRGKGVVGYEQLAGTNEAPVSGRINADSGAVAFKAAGYRHTWRIYTNLTGGATGLQISGEVSGCTFELIGWGQPGTVALDLTEAKCTGNNEFIVRFAGASTRVLMPRDTKKLPPGNTLTIDGVVQGQK